MLVKFTIHSVKATKKKYRYFDMSMSGAASKEKEAWEWEYEITSTDGDRYFLFHQKKPDPTIRQYRNCYGNAQKMVSETGTKYDEPYEGGYRLEYSRYPILIKALDTKEVFEQAAKIQIEREKEKASHAQTEIARLENLLNK